MRALVCAKFLTYRCVCMFQDYMCINVCVIICLTFYNDLILYKFNKQGGCAR